MQQLLEQAIFFILEASSELSWHKCCLVWKRNTELTNIVNRRSKKNSSPSCSTVPYYFQGCFFTGWEINSELFHKPFIFSPNILFYYLPFCCWFSFFLLLFFFFLIHSTVYWIFYSPVCISSLLRYLLLFTDKHVTPGRQAPLISIKTWIFFHPSLKLSRMPFYE